MKERPILFSTQMVQAILEGRKTMTRRVVKPQPDEDGLWNDDDFPRSLQSTLKNWNGQTKDGESREWKCHFGKPWDRLWVKETFKSGNYHPIYKADFKELQSGIKWTPSIFMPRSASRITLEITNIHVERLQDISEKTALMEGSVPNGASIIGSKAGAIGFFKTLWESINGKGSWDANPWVWVIEFQKIKG